jgi:hypothetical protein
MNIATICTRDAVVVVAIGERQSADAPYLDASVAKTSALPQRRPA